MRNNNNDDIEKQHNRQTKFIQKEEIFIFLRFTFRLFWSLNSNNNIFAKRQIEFWNFKILSSLKNPFQIWPEFLKNILLLQIEFSLLWNWIMNPEREIESDWENGKKLAVNFDPEFFFPILYRIHGTQFSVHRILSTTTNYPSVKNKITSLKMIKRFSKNLIFQWFFQLFKI